MYTSLNNAKKHCTEYFVPFRFCFFFFFFVLRLNRWSNRICHPRIFSGTNGNPCGKTAPWFTIPGYECAGGGSVKVSGLSYYLKNMFSRKLRIKLTKSPSFQRYELRPKGVIYTGITGFLRAASTSASGIFWLIFATHIAHCSRSFKGK